jgi:hypothetical protein
MHGFFHLAWPSAAHADPCTRLRRAFGGAFAAFWPRVRDGGTWQTAFRQHLA